MVLSKNSWQWEILFYILIIFHFILPLFGFMSRHVKRNVIGRLFFSILIIIVHYLDIRFMIYPNFTKQNEISLIEYILLGGFSLLIIGVLINLISSHKIIPDNDPRIKESEKLENAI